MSDPKTQQGIARRVASDPPPGWLPLRGASGRLHGYFDPQSLVIELKRKGEPPERIALGDLLKR